MSYVFLVTEVCSKYQMRSQTWQGVSKWSRGKDSYIGRPYLDIGKVPSDSGIFWSTGELQEFVLGLNGPYGKGEKGLKDGCAPSPWTSSNWTRERGRPLPSFSFSLPLFLFHVGGGILLGLGSPSRTPHFGRALWGSSSSSLHPLYTWPGGTLWTHKLILAVCGAPLHRYTPRLYSYSA